MYDLDPLAVRKLNMNILRQIETGMSPDAKGLPLVLGIYSDQLQEPIGKRLFT
jgi:hypothetical protein